MKIGIVSTAYLLRYGTKEGAKKMKLHGYDCVDFQGFINTDTDFFKLSGDAFEKTLKKKRKVVEEQGIVICQTHAPWRFPPKDFTEEDRAERLTAMKKAIMGTHYLGAKHFVVHPLMPFGEGGCENAESVMQINVDFFKELCSYANDLGVVVCIENMPFLNFPISSVESCIDFVKTVGKDNLKICLDTGHDLIWGNQPSESVKKIGGLLACLHVHDNDGKRDCHGLPKSGVCDWEKFAKALKEVDYQGVFCLETHVSDCPTKVLQGRREYNLIKGVKEFLE
ncbi:MAG: sugar phosphate isomerase/epimerase [Clostridia bacterium]|nr:sugar phosphate isomerase/epimerase [Clostridia bacterium]